MVLEDGRVASFSGLNAVGVFAVFLPLKINACGYSENLCRCLAFKIFEPFTAWSVNA